MDPARIVPRINQRRYDDTDDHCNGKIFGNGHRSYKDHHQRIRPGNAAQDHHTPPGESPDDDHEHHTDQRRQRNLFYQAGCNQNERQQKQRRRHASQPRATTGFDVDHRLTNHGAAAHAAKETSDQVRAALRQTFFAGAATFAGNLAHKVQG